MNMVLLYTAGTSTIAMAAWGKNMREMMLIMDQWRVHVFLLLNFLLLAIFLISLLSSSAFSTMHTEPESNRRKSQVEPEPKRAEEAGIRVTMNVNEDAKEKCGSRVDQHHDNDDEDQSLLLSNEELNERAEAFIAMFREHLVRDAAIEVRDMHLGSTIIC
ncbi:hypothetical protein LINGRAHAP2_LOCUS6810 [Linum grandiflorum]